MVEQNSTVMMWRKQGRAKRHGRHGFAVPLYIRIFYNVLFPLNELFQEFWFRSWWNEFLRIHNMFMSSSWEFLSSSSEYLVPDR